MKKILCALGAAFASVPLFAEDTSGGSSSVDLSAATTALSDVSDALVDWAGAALPYLAAIAGAFLVFWLTRLVFRMVKGWMSAAK